MNRQRPGQLRISIQDRLKNRAASSGRPVGELRRQYVMTRFLARVFTADPDGWILKGGTGMMVRLPAARYSRDVDLMSTDFTNADDAIDKLGEVLRHDVDAFDYTITKKKDLADGKGTQLSVQARLGTAVFETFSIDLVTHRGLVGPVEIYPIPQIIDERAAPDPVQVRVYPIADQIADKLCAMYERHQRVGQPPPGDTSTRYRDLADLLLISGNVPITLKQTVDALEHQRSVRNDMSLPRSLEVPGPDWPRNWPPMARGTPLNASLHDLDFALKAAAACYDSILGALPNTNRPAQWDPVEQQWKDG